MQIRNIYILIFLAAFTASCTSITGEETLNSVKISVSEAENILRNYMKTNNIPWGEPTFMKISPPKYIFEFENPKNEYLPVPGPGVIIEQQPPLSVARIIKVDMHTGEVTTLHPKQNKL